MSHAYKAKRADFFYEPDMSGDVVIVTGPPLNTVRVPGSVLVEFMRERDGGERDQAREAESLVHWHAPWQAMTACHQNPDGFHCTSEGPVTCLKCREVVDEELVARGEPPLHPAPPNPSESQRTSERENGTSHSGIEKYAEELGPEVWRSPDGITWTETKPYDPTQACPDCPIGGRDSDGPECPNAAACDRDCEEQVASHEGERVRALDELKARTRAHAEADTPPPTEVEVFGDARVVTDDPNAPESQVNPDSEYSKKYSQQSTAEGRLKSAGKLAEYLAQQAAEWKTKYKAAETERRILACRLTAHQNPPEQTAADPQGNDPLRALFDLMFSYFPPARVEEVVAQARRDDRQEGRRDHRSLEIARAFDLVRERRGIVPYSRKPGGAS